MLCSWTESWDVFSIGFVPVWLRAWRERKGIHGEGCGLEESKCNRSLLCSWTESWVVFSVGFVPVWLRALREGKGIRGEGCGLEESKFNHRLLCSLTESWDLFPVGSVPVWRKAWREGKALLVMGVDWRRKHVNIVCSITGLSRGIYSQLVPSLSNERLCVKEKGSKDAA